MNELDEWKIKWDKEEKKLVNEINRCYKENTNLRRLLQKEYSKLERIENVARKWFDQDDYSYAEILEILGVEFGEEE
tara:strand:+ start:386 stop:616 length:231 start_codon:yes stop_codon:yes gene_type:complete